MNQIPVMHCFNNNYVIPAAVSFFSMLKNSSKDFEYILYVLHSDIVPENQTKLQKLVTSFSNAKIEFINVENKFKDLFTKTKNKAHYSEEIYNKFLAPNLFKQYDKIIITDVDVVFLGDISEDFISFDTKEDFYLSGHAGIGKKSSWVEKYNKKYTKSFTDEESKKLKTCGGYWIFNLEKMRKDNLEEKFIEFANANYKRLRQPEQDTVNIICYPKMKFMRPNALVCTYLYDMFKTESDYTQCTNLAPNVLKQVLTNPVQLHYATGNKPWLKPGCTKSEIWFEYLAQTDFLKDYLNILEGKLSKSNKRKDLFKIKFPFSRKKLVIQKEI